MTDLVELAGALDGLEQALGREGPAGRGGREVAAVWAPRLLAIGWATVDLERTLSSLAGRDAGPETSEPSLGARGRVIGAGPIRLVLLEPSTEGRLAAALARHGEGICCLYLEAPDERATRLTALGLPGRLLPHHRPWGPFVIVVRAGGAASSPSAPGARSTPAPPGRPPVVGA
jgi:hypothetical protein